MKSMTYLFMVSAAIVSLAAKKAVNRIGPSEALTRIHAINQEEISAGKMAREKAHSEDIKRFGHRLVQDHTKADQKLQDIAKAENIDIGSTMTTSTEGAKQAMKSTTTLGQLKMLSGAKFDRAFVKAMEKDHNEAIHLLKSMQTSNAKVQGYIQELLPELKSHYEVVRKLKPIAAQENL